MRDIGRETEGMDGRKEGRKGRVTQAHTHTHTHTDALKEGRRRKGSGESTTDSNDAAPCNEVVNY